MDTCIENHFVDDMGKFIENMISLNKNDSEIDEILETIAGHNNAIKEVVQLTKKIKFAERSIRCKSDE